MDNENGFGVFNYCVFSGVLVISAAIGFYISFKGNKTPEEFLMGNRSLKPLPVSMSLLTTYVSALSIIGHPGETYANGMQICIYALGSIMALTFSYHFLVPILYPLKITSITEYIELRFKSKRLRYAIFLLSMVKSLISNGIGLFGSTIALSSVTGLGTFTCIFILGSVCAIYSAVGGIKAVIWTDVFQFSVIVIGLVIILSVGYVQNGGFFETFYIASKGGRLDIFNFNLSPFVRHTFFNTMTAGFFLVLKSYSSEQVIIQRICTVKTLENAKSVIKFNIFGKTFMYFLTYTSGLIAYATYAGCDPMALGIIKRKDKIMPYFVLDKLSFIPGLPGLFVATLIGGTLSTESSFINACVALVWRDICLSFKFFKKASNTYAMLTNKILSLVIGAVLIGLAILASNTKSLLEVGIVASGALNGPVLGVFLIGFFLPKCNIKGVWTGLTGSFALTLWVVIGGLLYKKPTPMLPFSADECLPLNISFVNMSRVHETISTTHSSNIEETNTYEDSFNSIYQISYTLYAMIGTLSCIILAVCVSFVTGNENVEEISPKYVSSYVHRFYWKKEELEIMEENELSLISGNTKDKLDQQENFDQKIDNDSTKNN